MAYTKTLKEARDLVTFLEGERSRVMDSRCKDIAEWVLPSRGFWPGDSDTPQAVLERGMSMLNPAPTLAVERGSGGLTTGMTPEGLPWFSLRVRDPKTMEATGVRQYLSFCEDMIYSALRMGRFYNRIHLCNLELFAFGSMLLFMDYSPVTLARFEACTFGSYAVDLDSEGNLSTVVRRMQWSAKELEEKYGRSKLSDKVILILDKNPLEKVDIIHLVQPNPDYKPGRLDYRWMAYKSLMFEADCTGDGAAEDVLSERGYHEMPYMFAPFIDTSGYPYGLGPGHNLVGPSMQLQEMEKQKLIAIQKKVNPSVKKPASMTGRVNTAPGGENKVSFSDHAGLGALYEVNISLQELVADIQAQEQRIAAIAKADLFYDLPQEMRPKDMTATEYLERKRERMQQIAPVISIYEPQVLDRVIERAFAMLDRNGLLPDPPEALRVNGRIEVDYVSTVAKALRQVGAEAARALLIDVRSMAETQVLAGGSADVLHKIDFAQAVDEIAQGLGSPVRMVRDDEDYEGRVQADRDARAQQAQLQNEQESLKAVAAAGNVKTDGTVAGKMMGAQ